MKIFGKLLIIIYKHIKTITICMVFFELILMFRGSSADELLKFKNAIKTSVLKIKKYIIKINDKIKNKIMKISLCDKAKKSFSVCQNNIKSAGKAYQNNVVMVIQMPRVLNTNSTN